VDASADLKRHLQRRRLKNYERSMARLSYAYGVDVRRSWWLAQSTIGNSLVRAVDRRWAMLARELMEHDFEDAARLLAPDLLQRIGRLQHLLRAPLPALRALRAGARASGRWPWVTPLAPTHGDVHWLVLDLEALAARTESELDFVLASALGHLQCDHGVFFTAHLLAARREGLALGVVRRALAPWSRVMAFSADRAGLLAAGDLDTALDMLQSRAEADAAIDWLPPLPAIELRAEALREFDRSVVMARIRTARANGNVAISLGDDVGPPPSPSSPSPPAAPPPTVGIPEDAWSLARCDERLTGRLRLL
jgi:hypothetical protein